MPGTKGGKAPVKVGTHAVPAGDLAAARTAWLGGQYSKAIDALDSASPRSANDRLEAALLAARCSLRLNQPAEALASLVRVDRDARADVDAADAVATLRGIAAFRTHDEPGGLALLAKPLISKDPYVVAERAYYTAFALWLQRRLDEAEGALAPALDERVELVHTRALGLLGWIETSRLRYAFAAKAFSEAFALALRSVPSDEHLLASLLHAISNFAVEMIDLQLARVVERDYDSIAWTPELAEQQSFILQNRAWLALLKGESDRAWRLFQDALALAPDAAYNLQVHTGLASLHRIVGDTFAANRHLDWANEFLGLTNWSEADYDERMALLELALEAARCGHGTATAALMRYHSAREADDDLAALRNDPRVAALETHASALLTRSRGEHQSAARALRKAAEQWSRLGYRMRYAQALIDLLEIQPDVQLVSSVESATAAVPKSWLRDAALALSSGHVAKSAALTPAERRVMQGICEGKSAREIAAEFGRSLHTINNQTRRVFQGMGVRSRAELIAKYSQTQRAQQRQPT